MCEEGAQEDYKKQSVMVENRANERPRCFERISNNHMWPCTVSKGNEVPLLVTDFEQSAVVAYGCQVRVIQIDRPAVHDFGF